MSRTTDIGITRVADADLSAKQYFAVKLTNNNSGNGVDLAGASDAAGGEAILGVLQNKPILGQAAEVMIAPCITRAVAAGAFVPGDPLKTDANGRFVKATGEAAGTLVHVVATALEPAAALGDIVEVALNHYVINRAIS
jgi:hypothetical protein